MCLYGSECSCTYFLVESPGGLAGVMAMAMVICLVVVWMCMMRMCACVLTGCFR